MKVKPLNKEQSERLLKLAEGLKEHLYKENDPSDIYNFQECVKVGRAQAFVDMLIKQLKGEVYF